MLASGAARAAGTHAGVSIVNFATATYTDDKGVLQSITSNSVAIQVEEMLDVRVSPVGVQPVPVAPGELGRMFTYRVVNGGNGPEGFALSATAALAGDQFDATGLRLIIDSDGDRTYEPLIDRPYAPGAEPLLQPDASLDVFVFADISAATASGDEGKIALDAAALTGSGAPGTLFAGRGEGGGDAVVGATTAKARAVALAMVSSALPTLAKAQSLSGLAGHGTMVTYSLTADLSSLGVSAPRISDPIPAGTRYVAGSLTLDGVPLTDAVDSDAGSFNGAGIEVALGTARQRHLVTFQVEID
jgi:uncharacterized repeat protein (TIGR01451 family)